MWEKINQLKDFSTLKNEIGYKTEKKINDLLKNGGFDQLRKLGFALMKDEQEKSEGEDFSVLLDKIRFRVQKKNYKKWELKYSYGENYGTTGIYFVNKFDTKKATVVFHHGFMARNPLNQLYFFTNQELFKKYNVVAIGMNGHESYTSIRDKCANTYLNFALSIAGSVLAVEEVVKYQHENGNKRVFVAGLSLGGIVASWHYFKYSTADFYIPMLAYPDVGEIFQNTRLKHLILNYETHKDNEYFANAYKIEKKNILRDKTKILPIIGIHDQTINYFKAKGFWEGYNVIEVDTGHYSIVTERNRIRNLLLEKFDEINK